MTVSKYYLSAWVLAIVVVAAVAAHSFALADAARITCALLVAGWVPLLVYRRCGNASPAGGWVLLALWLFLSWICVCHLETWCLQPSYSFESPNLQSDDGVYFNWALYHYDGRGLLPRRMAFKGFPLAMLGLFRVLGPSVLWPLAMNLMLTLLAVVVTGQTAARLLKPVVDERGPFLSTLGMTLTGTLMFFLSQGINIQKEASIYLAMSLVGYVAAGMARGRTEGGRLSPRDLLVFALGCAVMSLVRTTYLYAVFVAVALPVVFSWRGLWRKGASLMAVAVGFFCLGNFFALYSWQHHLVVMEGAGAMSKTFLVGAAPTQPYFDMLGPYFSYSIPHRLALVPFTTAVQFMIPFPWLYGNFDFVALFPRLAWGWYAVGGMALFYFFFVSWRRTLTLGAWPWIPALLFAGVAYIIGGSVNRYVLPIEPLFVPVAVYVVCLLRRGLLRKSFAAWSAFFVVVLAVTLVLCHHAQVSYFEHLDAYYRSIMHK